MSSTGQPFPRKLFKAGDLIFREGQAADCMYVIRSGKVELYLGDKENRKTLVQLGPNGLFGEMGLIDDKPRSANAIALEATECLIFQKEELSKRMETLDPFMKALIKVLVNTVREANKQKAG